MFATFVLFFSKSVEAVLWKNGWTLSLGGEAATQLLASHDLHPITNDDAVVMFIHALPIEIVGRRAVRPEVGHRRGDSRDQLVNPLQPFRQMLHHLIMIAE